MHRSPVRCFVERQSVDTLAPSAVAGAAAQQIVGRRFHATHDVVRGRPGGRPGHGGDRRRRAGATLLAVQRQRGLGARWPATRGANAVVASGNPCVSSATGLDNLPTPLGVPRQRRLGADRRRRPPSPARENEIAARQAVGAIGRVENLAVQLPPGLGHDDARRPRRQRAGLRRLRRGLARARRLQRGHRAHHRRPGGPDRAGRAAALQQLAPLGDVVDLKFDEQVRTGSSLAINALHLKVLSAAGTPVLDVIAGQAQRRLRRQASATRRGQTPTGAGSCNGANSGNGNGSANSADSRTTLANGVRGSTCGKLTMYFAENHKRSLTAASAGARSSAGGSSTARATRSSARGSTSSTSSRTASASSSRPACARATPAS